VSIAEHSHFKDSHSNRKPSSFARADTDACRKVNNLLEIIKREVLVCRREYNERFASQLDSGVFRKKLRQKSFTACIRGSLFLLLFIERAEAGTDPGPEISYHLSR